MSKTGWIILGTIFVVIFGAAAAMLALMMFTWVEAPTEDPTSDEVLREVEFGAPDLDDIGPMPQPEPELRGVDAANDANTNRRLEVLEAEVKRLREELATERAKTKPLKDLYEQAEKCGMLPPGGFEAGGPSLEVVGGPERGAPLAASLAKTLGLDDGRTKDFTEQYERWIAKVEALEKEHATVKVDGDTTTITIGQFGTAGDQLRREWDDYVAGALSADEKQAYDKQAARNRLLGARGGDWARTVSIKESGGTIRITEEGDDGKGGKTVQDTQGPAIARDMMLEDYAHLLK